MKTLSPELYESRARVAKALAHPSRLMIMEALEQQEYCVCELTEMVGADQSTISKHLAVLRAAGLVKGRKDGTLIWYSPRVPCLKGFWKCLDGVLRKDLEDRLRAVGD